ncbi:pentatricopeptide repeat-containing protein At5g61990, mitochondrial-like [Rosa rugosa]|uniref:pentatricopeptide repeat-containing protein At5g61990, mitochondrial-like n=1 Tax=Rosa rugosa TaxID=74645 RepID=UPI002B40892B|nr:pentatricopeptide repeat-containing protein At5g61990, mitochondrial-like [Rosa rugosa]
MGLASHGRNLAFQIGNPKSRLLIRVHYCSYKSESKKQEDDETVREICTILKRSREWESVLSSSGFPKKLNPCVVRSVLQQHHQLFGHAHGVLERMVRTRKPALEVLDCVVRCFREFEGSDMVVFEILINVFTMGGWFYEAADVFLGVRSVGISPRLECCNSLLNELLKGNRMRLFWKVYDGMLEAKIELDFYTYSNVINAHCKFGDVRQGKRLLFEMVEKGCNPNLSTFNVVIDGLCRSRAVDEAIELKKSSR